MKIRQKFTIGLMVIAMLVGAKGGFKKAALFLSEKCSYRQVKAYPAGVGARYGVISCTAPMCY